jgi:hypothetical protein
MAGIRSVIEPTDFHFKDGRHPDLLLLNPTAVSSTGRNVTFDFAVTSPITNSSLRIRSASTKGAAANAAYKGKLDTYTDFAAQNDLDFVPIIFESFGSCHPVVGEWISKLAANAASLHSIPVSVLVGYWKRRISVVLQRSNASLINRHILRTLPGGSGAFASRSPDHFDDNR